MRSVVNSCFVTYVLPSSGQIFAIYYTLYGLCKIIPLDGGTYVTKKTANSPPSCCLDIYSALYFYLCISVEDTNLEYYLNVSFRLNIKISLSSTGVSNSVSYAGHILTKKGSRATLRGKMYPRAAIGG
jgi:hypothetical protein